MKFSLLFALCALCSLYETVTKGPWTPLVYPLTRTSPMVWLLVGDNLLDRRHRGDTFASTTTCPKSVKFLCESGMFVASSPQPPPPTPLLLPAHDCHRPPTSTHFRIKEFLQVCTTPLFDESLLFDP